MTTGVLNWSTTIGSIGYSSPTITGGYLYIGTQNGKIFCLNATTGSIIWNCTTGTQMWSSPTVSSGCVYVGGYDDKFYCLNATTGIQIWNYTTGNEIFSSPAVASGYVYFGSKDDNCYCLNASTGGLVWNYLTGASIYENSPALALGCIYIGSGDGYLYCFKQGSITSALYWMPLLPIRLHMEMLSLESVSVTGAISYNIYRYTSVITELNSSLTEFTSINTLTWQDNITGYGLYYYVITAVNIDGESVISNCVSIDILLPPAAPSIILIIPNPSYTGAISLYWSASTGDNSYFVFRDINPIVSVTYLNFIANVTTISYNDTIGAVGTYYYAIIAENQFGNSSVSNCVNVTVSAPNAPIMNIITPNLSYNGSIALSWARLEWGGLLLFIPGFQSDYVNQRLEFYSESDL